METGQNQKILIMGGTREAADLAAKLHQQGHDITTSLAGRTDAPSTLVGTVRIGGFGGTDGLINWLTKNNIDRIIDATHPFAKQISINVKHASSRLNLPLETLSRPSWKPIPGDQWISVYSELEARDFLPKDARAFLALGRQHISSFAMREDIYFLLRMVDQPEDSLSFSQYDLIVGKPSENWHDEFALLKKFRISHVISRNSGGDISYAKIKATRELGIPVIMIERGKIDEQDS